MFKEPSEFNDRAPLTDEQIRAHTIGDLRPHSDKILIVPYDSCWPDLFTREAARIQAALGPRALRIEHTGSTSVPGLCAKPVIDLLLVVTDSANEDQYAPPLQRAGYTPRIREPHWFEHRMFKGPDTDINLHVLSFGLSGN